MTTINKRKLSATTKQWLQLVNVQTIEQLQDLDWNKETIRAQLGNHAAVTVSKEVKKLLAAAPQLIKVYIVPKEHSVEFRRRDNHVVVATRGISYMPKMNWVAYLYNKDGDFIKMIHTVTMNEAYQIIDTHVESMGMKQAPYHS